MKSVKEYAIHAEKVLKDKAETKRVKKEKKSEMYMTDLFSSLSETLYRDNLGGRSGRGGRGRGGRGGRRRGGKKRGGGEKDGACFVCGKMGHWAKECRFKKDGPMGGVVGVGGGGSDKWA